MALLHHLCFALLAMEENCSRCLDVFLNVFAALTDTL